MSTTYPNTLWSLLSFLGGINLTASLAFALVVCLLISGDYRLARYWLLLFGITLMLVGTSKLAFIGWGIGLTSLDFTGISGHAARAAVVYPPLTYLLSKNSTPTLQRAALGAAFVLAMGVAAARVVWKVHSVSEVVLGYLLGTVIALAYLKLNQRGSGLSLRFRLSCVIGAAVLALFLPPAPTQYWMIKTGLALSGHEQPFTREP